MIFLSKNKINLYKHTKIFINFFPSIFKTIVWFPLELYHYVEEIMDFLVH